VTLRRLMVIVSVRPSRRLAAASGWVRSILVARLGAPPRPRPPRAWRSPVELSAYPGVVVLETKSVKFLDLWARHLSMRATSLHLSLMA